MREIQAGSRVQVIMSPIVSPNNHMQRAGRHKLHAPDRQRGVEGRGCAPHARRPAADVGRWAALELSP